MGQKHSIFRSAKAKKTFHEAYEKTLSAWTVPYDTFFVETMAGKTYIIAAGDPLNPPLVLFHGLGLSSTMWIDSVSHLTRAFRIYAVDFIGDLNKSLTTRPISSKQQLAAWFSEVLDGLGLEKTHIAGLSFGGFFAVFFAAYLPDRIDKAVALSPGATLLHIRPSFLLRAGLVGIVPTMRVINWFIDYVFSQDSKMNPILKSQAQTALQCCFPRFRIIPYVLSKRELAKIKAQVLVIFGQHEVMYNPERALKKGDRLIRDFEGEILPGIGHGTILEKPGYVSEKMIQFLAGLSK